MVVGVGGKPDIKQNLYCHARQYIRTGMIQWRSSKDHQNAALYSCCSWLIFYFLHFYTYYFKTVQMGTCRRPYCISPIRGWRSEDPAFTPTNRGRLSKLQWKTWVATLAGGNVKCIELQDAPETRKKTKKKKSSPPCGGNQGYVCFDVLLVLRTCYLLSSSADGSSRDVFPRQSGCFSAETN